MIQRTIYEIQEFVDKTWPDAEKRQIKKSGDDIMIELSSMYSAPGLGFHNLIALSEFMGTKNINDDDRFGRGGCETCDYGSSYGFTLTVRPEAAK